MCVKNIICSIVYVPTKSCLNSSSGLTNIYFIILDISYFINKHPITSIIGVERCGTLNGIFLAV